MTEVFNSTCEKAKTLEELNKKPQSAATLRGLTSSLSSEFQSAEDLAGILMERLAGFSEQKRSLEYNIDAKLQQLVRLQERLQEADNVLGNADDILRRMNVAKVTFYWQQSAYDTLSQATFIWHTISSLFSKLECGHKRHLICFTI